MRRLGLATLRSNPVLWFHLQNYGTDEELAMLAYDMPDTQSYYAVHIVRFAGWGEVLQTAIANSDGSKDVGVRYACAGRPARSRW